MNQAFFSSFIAEMDKLAAGPRPLKLVTGPKKSVIPTLSRKGVSGATGLPKVRRLRRGRAAQKVRKVMAEKPPPPKQPTPLPTPPADPKIPEKKPEAKPAEPKGFAEKLVDKARPTGEKVKGYWKGMSTAGKAGVIGGGALAAGLAGASLANKKQDNPVGYAYS